MAIFNLSTKSENKSLFMFLFLKSFGFVILYKKPYDAD